MRLLRPVDALILVCLGLVVRFWMSLQENLNEHNLLKTAPRTTTAFALLEADGRAKAVAANTLSLCEKLQPYGQAQAPRALCTGRLRSMGFWASDAISNCRKSMLRAAWSCSPRCCDGERTSLQKDPSNRQAAFTRISEKTKSTSTR